MSSSSATGPRTNKDLFSDLSYSRTAATLNPTGRLGTNLFGDDVESCSGSTRESSSERNYTRTTWNKGSGKGSEICSGQKKDANGCRRKRKRSDSADRLWRATWLRPGLIVKICNEKVAHYPRKAVITQVNLGKKDKKATANLRIMGGSSDGTNVDDVSERHVETTLPKLDPNSASPTSNSNRLSLNKFDNYSKASRTGPLVRCTKLGQGAPSGGKSAAISCSLNSSSSEAPSGSVEVASPTYTLLSVDKKAGKAEVCFQATGRTGIVRLDDICAFEQ